MENKGLRITAKIKPGSKKNGVFYENGVLIVSVTSRPVEGKANSQALELIADTLGISKGNCTIISGLHYKIKCIEIVNCSREHIKNCLKNLSQPH